MKKLLLVLSALYAFNVSVSQEAPEFDIPPGEGAALRVAHLSPDAAEMNVTIADSDPFGGLAFRDVTDYQVVPSGSLVIRITSGDDPLIDATLEVEAGAYYTIAAVGYEESLEARVYRDNLRPFPPANGASLRVLHALPGAGAVDLAVRGGDLLVEGLDFAQVSEYFFVAAGDYDLDARAAGGDEVALALDGVEIRAGHVYTLFAIEEGESAADAIMTEDAPDGTPAPAGEIATDTATDTGVIRPTPAQAVARPLRQAPAETGILRAVRPVAAAAITQGADPGAEAEEGEAARAERRVGYVLTVDARMVGGEADGDQRP
ncbi:MAG: DUF4397 domain-containing protein [Deinococcota bacterium]|nr:DUF4397 domain-containing protein [Deinococcota bacterium]